MEQAVEPRSTKERSRKRPSNATLNCLSVLVGLCVAAVGLAYLIYSDDTPMFAIPLVMTVPVIAAVAFRNIWD
jgi:ABC-type Mn2+/Zn2+ transport system permease subunit